MSSEFYHSQYLLSSKTKQQDMVQIVKYIYDHSSIRCKALKRNIFLIKYIEANKERKDARIRFQSFFVGIDIIKKSIFCDSIIIDGFQCYRIIGYAKNNEIVEVYLREEIIKNDKILFLISTFSKDKKKASLP